MKDNIYYKGLGLSDAEAKIAGEFSLMIAQLASDNYPGGNARPIIAGIASSTAAMFAAIATTEGQAGITAKEAKALFMAVMKQVEDLMEPRVHAILHGDETGNSVN